MSAGKPRVERENLWCPVTFPFNQSNDTYEITTLDGRNPQFGGKKPMTSPSFVGFQHVSTMVQDFFQPPDLGVSGGIPLLQWNGGCGIQRSKNGGSNG